MIDKWLDELDPEAHEMFDRVFSQASINGYQYSRSSKNPHRSDYGSEGIEIKMDIAFKSQTLDPAEISMCLSLMQEINVAHSHLVSGLWKGKDFKRQKFIVIERFNRTCSALMGYDRENKSLPKPETADVE